MGTQYAKVTDDETPNDSDEGMNTDFNTDSEVHEPPVAWVSTDSDDAKPPSQDVNTTPTRPVEPLIRVYDDEVETTPTQSVVGEVPLLVVDSPADLLNCRLDELQTLCEEYGITPVARSKLQLIARILSKFPPENVTEATLNKFTTRKLSRLAEALGLPFFGLSKEDLIKNILVYHRSAERPELVERDLATDEDSTHEVPTSPEIPTRTSHEKKRFVQRTLTDFPLSSNARKRSRLNYEEEPAEEAQPIKKRKITTDTFMDFSSPLTLKLHNRPYDVFPTLLEGSKMGWSREGRQQMNVEGRPVTVKWSLKASVVRPGQPSSAIEVSEIPEGAGVGLDEADRPETR